MKIFNIRLLQVISIILTTISLHTYSKTIAFEHVNVIPMDKEIIMLDQRVIVTDGIISSITPASSVSTTTIDQKINGSGKYLLPGFSDTHFHQTGNKLENAKNQFTLLIANGITSVINMAEHNGQDTIATRHYANAKESLAPYFLTVGPLLHEEDLKTTEDAKKIVSFHKQRGYDFIKIHGNVSKEAYLALLREADTAGIPVVGHAQRKMPLEYTLRLSLIAHMEEIVNIFSDEDNLTIVDLNTEMADSIAKDVKNSGVYLAPTLSILSLIENYTNDDKYSLLKKRSINQYLLPSEFKSYTTEGNEYRRDFFLTNKGKEFVSKIITANKQLTLAMYKAGVPLLVGTDNIGLQIPGFSIHDEMQQMHEAGIPAFDVIRAATVTSARFMKRYAIAGTINEGKNADLVLLNHNPLEDIKNTRSIQGVMIKGIWHDRKALDKMLEQTKVYYQQQ